jgi:DNA-binding ferritin-like protein (Dps family)
MFQVRGKTFACLGAEYSIIKQVQSVLGTSVSDFCMALLKNSQTSFGIVSYQYCRAVIKKKIVNAQIL